MRSPALLLIGAATVCGMVASIGLSQLLEAPAGKQTRPVERVRIYVAQRDIAPGQMFTEANLRLETWDVDSVPPGVVVRFEETLGKVSRERIKAGEPLQAGWLALVSRPAAPAPHAPTVAVTSPAAPAAASPAATAAASPHASPADASPAPSQQVEPTQAQAPQSDVVERPSAPLTPPTATPPTTEPATALPEDATPQAVVEQAKPRLDTQAAQSPTPATPTEVREATPDGVVDSDPQFAATAAPQVPTAVRKPKAVGSISDAGWVMTIRREGGVKSLRYRVTSEVNRDAKDGGHSPTPARQSAEESLDDRAARKTGDSKKS